MEYTCVIIIIIIKIKKNMIYFFILINFFFFLSLLRTCSWYSPTNLRLNFISIS